MILLYKKYDTFFVHKILLKIRDQYKILGNCQSLPTSPLTYYFAISEKLMLMLGMEAGSWTQDERIFMEVCQGD